MTRSEFITELNSQPANNKGIKETKINIHFPIRGNLVDYCYELNSTIRSVTKSKIDFSPNSFQIPHLTIEMGFIRNSLEFAELMESLYNFSKKIKKFTVTVSNPSLSSPNPNYVFLGILEKGIITKIRVQAKEVFKKWIIPLNWDISKSKPHITVGNIKNSFNEVKSVLKNTNKQVEWKIESIEISYVGAWGSCIGTIREFELSE
jgi:2'-5' RNA ligase